MLICIPALAGAQGSAGTEGKLEPRWLIDVPTAGMLDRSSLSFDVDFYQQGGVIAGVTVGVFDRLSFGLSYGGSRLIGAETPSMNPIPGINVRFRLIEESVAFPALALGFDSQGKDGYLDGKDRYAIKSPGLFAVASKNWQMLGYFSLHGGVNYSFERADGDDDINIFFGAEKTLGPVFSLVAEYNLGINDNGAAAIGRGRGYVNAGFRWFVGSGLTLAVNLKDIIRNGQEVTIGNRTVHLEYIHRF